MSDTTLIIQPRTGCRYPLKSILDSTLAAVLIVLLCPFLLLIALAIRLDSRGPAIYRQARIGRFGKTFTMLKFRTMEVGTPVLSTEEMQRRQAIPFTRLGPFLRNTSLDELPQLFNVLQGQMSFVGPRPALPTQTDVNALREQNGVHDIRPGITGLAQVMGRDNLDTKTKVDYDTQYCTRMSVWFDTKIFFMTAGAVTSKRGNK
jgi:O-antigen biosynthesis protein WbqP